MNHVKIKRRLDALHREKQMSAGVGSLDSCAETLDAVQGQLKRARKPERKAELQAEVDRLTTLLEQKASAVVSPKNAQRLRRVNAQIRKLESRQQRNGRAASIAS